MLGVQGEATTAEGANGSESATGSNAAEAASAAAEPSSEPGGTEGTAVRSGATAGAVAEAIGQTAYTPNFKFKVLDKELEFDDFIRGAIKDADTEKKVRELYEKSHGLDSVKADRTTLRSELAAAKEKMGKTDSALETLGNYVRQGDYDSFFESLNIPKENILRYALQLVQRENSPELKAQYEQQRQAQYYQQAQQGLAQQQQQFFVQQREFELTNVLSRPENTAVVQAYEAGMGQPGAFRRYVIQIGQAMEAQGQNVTAEQAVQMAISHLKAVNPQLAQPVTNQPTSNVVQPSQKPVIPNIQGKGTSPVRSNIRSLDQLKKLAQERIAAEG